MGEDVEGVSGVRMADTEAQSWAECFDEPGEPFSGRAAAGPVLLSRDMQLLSLINISVSAFTERLPLPFTFVSSLRK